MTPLKIHQNSVSHWIVRALWVAATAAFVLYIPNRSQVGTISDVTFAFELGVAAMALNLVMGYGGIISLGHSAFFGVGGYTSAILIDHYDWGHGWTLVIAPLVGFVAGFVSSLPALRLKGVYLALTSLGLAVLFPQLIRWRKAEWLTDGARGIDRLRYDELPDWPILGELSGREGRAELMYWLAFVTLAASYLVCRGIVKSRVGRSLVAIRDNDTAAEVMGVNLARTKTLVYGLSAAMTASAGALFGIRLNGVNVDIAQNPFFNLTGAIIFLVIMVLGGAATLWGPIIGAIVYVFVDNTTREWGTEGEGIVGFLFGWLKSSPATFILAVALLVTMFTAPYGIVGLLKRLAARFVAIVPAPAGTATIVTPVEEVVGPAIDEPFHDVSTEEAP